jgi:tetratricopeptide (TPR) repeat protein
VAICLFALENFAKAQDTLREALLLSRGKMATLPDRRQCAEILNNLACLCYTCGEPMEAFDLFSESLEIPLAVAEDSLYLGSKFSCHSSSLNSAMVRANLGFLSLISRDLSTARLALESAVKEQSLLLRDAHVTLVCTMDYLAVVHLLADNKEKALQVSSSGLCVRLYRSNVT